MTLEPLRPSIHLRAHYGLADLDRDITALMAFAVGAFVIFAAIRVLW